MADDKKTGKPALRLVESPARGPLAPLRAPPDTARDGADRDAHDTRDGQADASGDAAHDGNDATPPDVMRAVAKELGLTADASVAEITKAFNALALQFRPKKEPRDLRRALSALLWRPDVMRNPDLLAVLDGCNDPSLAKKMAAIVRKHWKNRTRRTEKFDRLIKWLDAWDGSEATAADVASDLVECFMFDEETGQVLDGPPRCVPAVADALAEAPRDGEARLRKGLLALGWSAERVGGALNYLAMRAKRTTRPTRKS